MLDQINLVFTILFTFEVVLKLIGFGFRPFCRDNFNIFDALIVIMSLLELVLGSGGGISALRAFRLFRVFKLFRVGDLRILIDSIIFTVSTIGNYVVLLILFIYVYALLGMQFFAGRLKFNKESGLYDENGEVPRANFDSLLWACMTIFQILMGDNWNAIMYDCIRTVGAVASIYYITLIMFGNIVMLNLFLAILLGNFDRARTGQMKQKIIEIFHNYIHIRGYSLRKECQLDFTGFAHSNEQLFNGEEKKKVGTMISPMKQSSLMGS